MQSGLYQFCIPSGSVVVLRYGWLRRIEGDEYEVLNYVIPKRGEYNTMPSEACSLDGPPEHWTFTRTIKRSLLLRTQIYDVVDLSAVEDKWAKLCPKPDGWADGE